MNKKIITLILVILISFCFLSIVVADNVSHDGKITTDHDKTIHKGITDKIKKAGKDSDDNNNDTDKNETDNNNNDTDKNKTDDKNKTNNTSKKNYIIAKGHGNDIKFSDGSRGFILDYSKKSASSGDKFKHVSTSKISDSNTLKLAVIECYRQNATDQMGKIMADFVKTGSSNTKVGEAVATSHEKVGDHDVVKIDNDTEGVFDFEGLKSVSGNESDYFAYKVAFRTIDDGGNETNQSNNASNATIIANVTNPTNETNTTNETNITNETNATNETNNTNITNITDDLDNDTNVTFLNDLYEYLAFIAASLYDVWSPIIDTLINDYLMIVNAISELTQMYNEFITELQSLIDGIGELLNMLQSIWNELNEILKLIGVILTAIGQLLNLIGSILNFIAGLISSIIGLIQQLLGFLSGLIDFIVGLISQILSAIQAVIDFLKSVGSSFIKVFENAAIIITVFVIITIGAFVYNRIR